MICSIIEYMKEVGSMSDDYISVETARKIRKDKQAHVECFLDVGGERFDEFSGMEDQGEVL